MKPYEKMDSLNTALVVIDIVNGCCHKDCEDLEIGVTFSNIRDMVPKLNDFIEDFRAKIGGKIVFVNLTPWTKEYLPANIQQLYEDPSVAYYSDGNKFEEEFYVVRPKKEDAVITKNNYDAFTNPELNKLLKENGIQYLIMTGVFTDGCVLATVAGGFSRGYNFVILKDLVETTDVQARQELCKHLIGYTFPNLYGKTITSKELLTSWHS
jgi:nicotinamidase-related amidase